MKFFPLACLSVISLTLSAIGEPVRAEAAKALHIYWVDVEGGAATLIVTPAGESVLIDAGSPGERDAGRIVHVARDVAGLRQIDHLVVTHWHSDHVGGVPMVSKLIPVQHYYDRGFPQPARDIDAVLVAAYRKCSQGKSVTLAPGDEIALTQAAGQPAPKLRVVAGGGLVLGEKPGAPQTGPCQKGHPAMADDSTDNARSLAFVLTFGVFKFFDGGDLTWNTEHRLACPVNLVGPVDVYQSDHHGLDISNNPALLEALHPSVAVINNGPQKGGSAKTFARLKALADLQAIFQLHRNIATTAADNAPPECVANDDAPCKGEFIELSVDPSGTSYSVGIPAKGAARRFARAR